MNWLQGLNAQQREAVLHDFGPLLILAGAGSGKTTVLVSRTGRLIDERIASAEQICVLTFTNKAARELKARVASKLGPTAKKVWAGTFHSFGMHLLRRFHKEAGLSREFGVLDESDASAIAKELIRDFHNADKEAYDPRRLLEILSQWREVGKVELDSEDEYDVAAEWLLPKYLKRLSRLGMVDFDELILRPISLFQSHPHVLERVQSEWTQIMVDEFQDTNLAQMKLVRLLSSRHQNLSVVGDDDQSIYAWRGACIENILHFPRQFDQCKVVKLETNYRSTKTILDLANHVIEKNKKRHPKTLIPMGGEVGKLPELLVFADETEEVEGVASEIQSLLREGYRHAQTAVLYRSNSQGALLEAEFRKHQIPYEISGGTAFFDRKETKDVLAYLRCSIRSNEISFRRVLNTPSRGIGDKTVELLESFSQHREVGFQEAARRWQEAGVESRAGNSLTQLFVFLDAFPNRLLQGTSPGLVLLQELEAVGYRRYLDHQSKDALAASRRWKFVEILSGVFDRFLSGARTVSSLKEFLDSMELRDTRDDGEPKDSVQLMTLHACKGLEFPAVVLVGVEEEILPHKKLGSDIAEERRLFYVGITRAKERLVLTRVRRRNRNGRPTDAVPSRFLVEVPPALLQERHGPRQVPKELRKAMLAELFQKLDQ